VAEKPTKGGMGGGLVPGTYPPPATSRPQLVGEKFAVVAGHPLVSMVAMSIFEAGGNAVDAGVAAGIASNVIQVDMANFGGIAPILLREAGSDQCVSIAGVGRWSESVSLDALVARHGGHLPLGGAPCIVPGAPAGWLSALSRAGTMSFAEVAQPALAYARSGFLLDQGLALSLGICSRGFDQWPSSVEVYRPGNRALQAGDRLVQPALANTLERLMEAEKHSKGSREQGIRAAHDEFYSGDIAQIISAAVEENGGFLTVDDFARFEAEVAPAPSLLVDGWRVHATPSWSQGPVALQILGIMMRTPGTWHHLIEATTRAFCDREDFLAAPDAMDKDIQELLADDYLDFLAHEITDEAAPGRSSAIGIPGATLGSTTSIVTMDASGCTFAASPSDTLDGGPIIPELGILCSPRGVQSRLSSSHPNRVRPGGRPVVTPAPIIATQGDESWALACPGGDVIVQAMAQVMWRVMTTGASLQEASEAPRFASFSVPSAFHPHPSADRLVYTEGRIAEREREQLRAQGHHVEVWPDFEFDAGSVQTIQSAPNTHGERVLTAGADPRRLAYGLAR
jgi:gamma-glutamyltranspeptidase/glutathione hydrolase